MLGLSLRDKQILKNLYPNTKEIYGPYLRKDNRLMLVLVGFGKSSSLSYPKALEEIKRNKRLDEDETVDHIDGNPLNNDPENRRIISRADNAKLGPVNRKPTSHFTLGTCNEGEKNGMAKLTKAQVNDYRERYKKGLIAAFQIEKETGLSRKTVENFLKRRSYR